MDRKKVNRIWGLSLIVFSLISLGHGILSIAGIEIPPVLRIIISLIQVAVGILLVVASVLTLKNSKK